MSSSLLTEAASSKHCYYIKLQHGSQALIETVMCRCLCGALAHREEKVVMTNGSHEQRSPCTVPNDFCRKNSVARKS